MNTIGRYQIVEKLGQGGMGVVYRAFDPLLQRVVAVKLIANLEAGDELRERFFREARAAGQLSHKNIITIYDLGEHEGLPFLAMEFLEGQDLQHRMAGGPPMSLARKLEIAVEVCEGIEYAHDHGVVHRDIKPANIFLTTKGTAKLLDFGLARLITSELTNSNMMMGTLNYMAPEQVRGERADHRSDIFSTGVVLYELFGGRKAFEGDSFGATLYKILEEVPAPLRSLDSNLPPEIEAVVERALAKPRDARYPHMSDMLRELSFYRQQLMLTNSPPLGGSSSDVVRIPSDAPRQPLTPLTPSSGVRSDVQPIAHDAPTIATPTPLPLGSPGSGRPPGSNATAVPSRRRAALVPGVAAAVLLVIAAAWAINRYTTTPAAPAPQTAAGAPADSGARTPQAIASELEQASRALQTGDQAAARRHADAVLAMAPGHAEARRLRDRAQQASETVERSLSNAHDALEAGRFEDATRAAGEVLAVDPNNADARRVMDEASTRSRGKGLDEARTRMIANRKAAVAAGAQKLASAPFNAASAAERDASALFKRGRPSEAMAKYWEASGLFRSAEVAAQTEAAARAERARAAQAEPPADPRPTGTSAAGAPPVSKPTATPPSPPVNIAPIPTTTGLPASPVAPPVAPPDVPKAPAPQPAPADTTPQASPTAIIQELLERYETALEARNLDALKRLWPSLGGAQEAAIRQEFQNATRIDVEIVSPQISVNGSTAAARFVRRYQLQTVDGQRLASQSRTTITLQRTGQNWTITQIRFDPIR